jgi:hypothetical protein
MESFMLKKIKKMKLARELIAVILATILYKFQPNALNENYTIFVALMFVSTIPGSNEESSFIKNFSLPALTFYVVTIILIFGVIDNLTLNYILTLGALTNVKAIKKIIASRISKKLGVTPDAVETKEESTEEPILN